MAKFSFRIFSCVVRGLPFYIGVVVPVTLVLTKNFIVLMLVLRGITNSQFKKNKKRELMVSARIAFACSILLGTTWIFGILAIGDLSYFFQCLFCVFNSFQGCFIFLFYTVRNTEARKHWKRALRLQQSGTMSATRSSRLGSSGKICLQHQGNFLKRSDRKNKKTFQLSVSCQILKLVEYIFPENNLIRSFQISADFI